MIEDLTELETLHETLLNQPNRDGQIRNLLPKEMGEAQPLPKAVRTTFEKDQEDKNAGKNRYNKN